MGNGENMLLLCLPDPFMTVLLENLKKYYCRSIERKCAELQDLIQVIIPY